MSSSKKVKLSRRKTRQNCWFLTEECKTCHLAGCIAWEEFTKGDPRIGYHKSEEDLVPEAGDIVLYDRVFEDHEHDHIGIVIGTRENTVIAAEGNIDNRSAIIERPVYDTFAHISVFPTDFGINDRS